MLQVQRAPSLTGLVFYSTTIGNANLKPEKINTWEPGTEWHFLNSSTILDAVYYNKTSKYQIIPVSQPGSTGAQYTSPMPAALPTILAHFFNSIVH